MPKEFKKHMMHGGGKSKMANSKSDHDKYKADGMDHTKPPGFKLREVNSPMLCWKTHKKVGMKDSPTYGASVQVNDCKKK